MSRRPIPSQVRLNAIVRLLPVSRSLRSLVVDDEFFGIEQRPDEVSCACALVCGAGEIGFALDDFFGRWEAAHGSQIGVFDDLFGSQSLLYCRWLVRLWCPTTPFFANCSFSFLRRSRRFFAAAISSGFGLVAHLFEDVG